jgi:putative CocE/NonD family hydrolase
VSWFRQWQVAEVPTDPFWQSEDPARFEAAARTTTVPVMMVGGWSDAFIEAQWEAWQQLPDRSDAWWIVGPWAHLGQVPSAVPLRGLRGPGSGGGAMPQLPRVVDWLGTHLQGADARYPQQGVVTYVVGGDRWEVRSDWPPPTRERSWSVSAGAGRCDGELRPGAQPLDTPIGWTYDPDDPLPSRGGAGLLAGAVPLMNGVKPGFVRYRDRCRRRDDVWRFQAAPLEAPLHLAGIVRVELEVASDAEDTAFGFQLLERREGGKVIVLREGFATLALRDGPPRRPYTPGERVRVVADTQPLEAELQPGSSLVVVLTSSSFPAVEAHPNVAGTLARVEQAHVARQQVFAATLVIPEVVR